MKQWMLPVCAAALAAAVLCSCAPLQVATKVLEDRNLESFADSLSNEIKSQPSKMIGHDYTAPNEITRIEIDDRDAIIDIKALSVSNVQMTYMETEYSNYSVQTVGSTLKIKKNTNWREESERFTITIKVPSSLLDRLKIEGDNLEVNISNLQVGRLEMEAENSFLMMDNMTGNEVSIEAEQVFARLNNNVLGRLTVEADNSNLELNQVKSDAYDCELENGDISGVLIGQETDYNIRIQVRNGTSTLNSNSNLGAEKSLRFEVDNGNVKTNFQL